MSQVTNEDIMRAIVTVQKTQEQIQATQEKQSLRVMRVERSLVGDKEYGVKGLIDTVKDQGDKIEAHSKKHDEIDTFKKRAAGFFAACSLLVTGFIWLLKEAINYFKDNPPTP
jgi:DNA replicative helicase MCM subunit Mcm2 (Cdc46/Mcm family)